jgi:hypothetical protein
MCSLQAVTNNTNTQPTRCAFINKASNQPNAQNMIRACSDSYFFCSLVEYGNFWNFSNTCQLLFRLKKYLIYRLNKHYSGIYYVNKNMILEKIKIFNPQKQLSLDLSYALTNIKADALGKVHTLNLKGCSITDVDLDALIDVYNLNLTKCHKITNVSALKKVNTLNLSYCTNITDFSPLRNVHTLNLSGCYQYINVSALANVYNLNLSNTKVTDVSALGRVHTLDLRYCYGIIDFSALNNIHTLFLPR